MWARVPWSQGGCWHPKMVMAQGQLHFGGTVVVRRTEMCLCRATAAPVPQNGPRAWFPSVDPWQSSPGTVPGHSTPVWTRSTAPGIAPLYGPQARHPTLIPRHCPPEHCPTRWVLLLPPSSAPS